MRWVPLLAVLSVVGVAMVSADESATSSLVSVPITRDLAADAALAVKAGVPLLLVFAQEHCNYCEQLDREVLNPNYATGAYDGKVVVRRFMIDSQAMVVNFDGKRVETGELTHQLRVYVTPTLLLLDANGHELAPRTVGIDNIDFYNAYLDQSIDAARAKLAASNSRLADEL